MACKGAWRSAWHFSMITCGLHGISTKPHLDTVMHTLWHVAASKAKLPDMLAWVGPMPRGLAVKRFLGCLQISFIEIHQDDIRDLLGDAASIGPIHVRESPERGTYIENAQ